MRTNDRLEGGLKLSLWSGLWDKREDQIKYFVGTNDRLEGGLKLSLWSGQTKDWKLV